MQQLTGPDAMFLHTELEGFPMHIAGVSVYDQSTSPDGVVGFEDIMSMFESRLDRSPIFRRKLAVVPLNLDQPYWIDDEKFDLEFHLRQIALPKPGDWSQLCTQVARLHARPLDRNRPLWEAYVIEGLNNVEGVPEDSFALYLKVHHCAVDGASGVQFFAAFNDPSPETPEPRRPAPWRPEAAPSTAELLGRAYLNALRKPQQAYRLARQLLPARKRVTEGIARGDFHKVEEVPSTRFNGRLSPHRVVDAVKFDFEDIRAIKNTVPGATVNDAMLTIVSGGMRKYLQSKNELPKQSLVTACPVNVRDESEKDAQGNMVASMVVPLRSDVGESLERLRKVHEEAATAKSYTQALGPRIAIDVLETVPAGLQSMLVSLTSSIGLAEKNVMYNTTMTNVPAAPYQLYMCGAQIVDSFGIGPVAPGLALFHTVNSTVMKNRGVITLAFVCCRDTMPDPAFYALCLQESFEELRDACAREKQPAKRTGKGKKVKARARKAASPDRQRPSPADGRRAEK